MTRRLLSAPQLLPERDVIHPVDLDELSHRHDFVESVTALAEALGRSVAEVKAETIEYLHTMDTAIDPTMNAAWMRLGRWFMRAYDDVVVDEAAFARLRELDRSHSLVWLPSHRSYLDLFILPIVLASHGISPAFGMGGANLDFFPFGTMARRTGTIFIRRTASDDAIYRFALRWYVTQLTRNGGNIAWSIEGGRTRTGKLRPPRYGLLRYLVDGTAAIDGPETQIVPVSIVYDQLHEVANMTAEALGGGKKPEDLAWLIKLARQQRKRLGHVYFEVGEPIPLRERLAQFQRETDEGGPVVERIGLEVSYRINRATPVTPTAVVTMALLAADRALTLEQVHTTVQVTDRYLKQRDWPVAGGQSLTDRDGIRQTLRDLVGSGIVIGYEEGSEPVWTIAPGKHLVAAFYRNTTIHVFVNRAIAEVALLAAAGDSAGPDHRATSYRAALALRDLLKFEFFFASRKDFDGEMRAELNLIDPEWDSRTEVPRGSGDELRRWLERASPHVAHLVLRPFLEAYLVLAELLAGKQPDERIDEDALLAECVRVGQQWVLQRRLASSESVSLELFRTALRLAKHRELVSPGDAELDDKRSAFMAEIRGWLTHLDAIQAMDARAHADDQ
ncbi:MAG: lysophospholipid acyltransferase [Humibacillus sp.]|nr:lysophospholipid acyltransferase [Humibacillus sp.]MDN5779084.1 lysophospholipid acyltransferase [Humibacillus sp.]